MFSRRFILIAVSLLWCACGLAQSVREIAMLEVPGKPGFDGVAVAKGMVLISHAGANTVDIFDPVKRRLIGHVNGMSDPRGIAVDQDGGQVFIANHGAKNIVVLAADDFHVTGTIPLSASPRDLVYIPKWGMLAATDPISQQLMLVDVRSRQQANAVPIGATPGGLAFEPTRDLLCVTLQDAKQVVAVNRDLRIVQRMPLNASQPTGIVYDQKQDRLYVAVRYAVLSLNGSDGAELSRVPADGGIDRLWLDADSRMLYGAAGGSLLVMKADARLHAVDELATDVKGYLVAYDPEHKLVFFPGARDGRSKLLLLKAVGEGQAEETDAEAKLH